MKALLPDIRAAAPFVAGLVLVVVGAALGDDTLRQLGYGALAASGLTYAARRKP